MSAAHVQAGLRFISQLFSYPESIPSPAGLRGGIAYMAKALAAEMNRIDPVRLQNEYVRLFINALPEVPCAPYGSVYLEGRIMGRSTVKVGDIYRKYNMVPSELPDHIAVETEFLAWLHSVAGRDETKWKDYNHLLNHLKQWIHAFFGCVEKHDQLGCYKHGAGLARIILQRKDEKLPFRSSGPIPGIRQPEIRQEERYGPQPATPKAF